MCQLSHYCFCRGEERVKSAHLVSEPSNFYKMQLNAIASGEWNSDAKSLDQYNEEEVDDNDDIDG